MVAAPVRPALWYSARRWVNGDGFCMDRRSYITLVANVREISGEPIADVNGRRRDAFARKPLPYGDSGLRQHVTFFDYACRQQLEHGGRFAQLTGYIDKIAGFGS